MTNEEAVEVLEDMKMTINIPKAAELQRKRNEAIDMAIEALSNSEIPNSSDMVSRQAVLDAYADIYWIDERLLNFRKELDSVYDKISNLPSAQPEKHTNKRTKMHECDLISRQNAIYAIVNTVSEIGLHDNSEVARYGATFRQHEILDIIKGMPSAEPKIIHCMDCKHYYYPDNRIPEERRYTCDLDGDRWRPDSFCSFAERRTDERHDKPTGGD